MVMKQVKDNSNITRDILNTIRSIQESQNLPANKKILREDGSDKELKAVAITDDPRFGQGVLSSQEEQFRASVESGAQFSEPSEDNVADSPLIYMPETGNLVFGGIIPCLNNLKWQFVLKTNTGNGCFIWTDGLILNKENMIILNKLYGHYMNWRDQWNTESADLERIGQMMNQD